MIDIWGWCLFATLVITSDAQQLKGPIIMSHKEILLQKGQNYTIYCKGKRPLLFKQQETAEEMFGDFTKTQRNVAPSDTEYEYEIGLDLYNVDQFAVGYYACHDDLVDGAAAVRDLVDEPRDTDHVAFTYVYVNDSELIAPMREFVNVKSGSKIVVECRPTFPDIQVNLTMAWDFTESEYERYSPKIGFILDSDNLFDLPAIECICEFVRKGERSVKKSFFLFKSKASLEKPKIIGKQKYFLENETISLNCTVPYKGSAITLKWTIPRGNFNEVDINITSNELQIDKVLYRAIRVHNAKKSDEGSYICTVKASNDEEMSSKPLKIKYLAAPFLNIKSGSRSEINTSISPFIYLFNLDAYPPAQYKFFKDDRIPITNGTKYEITENEYGRIMLTINDVVIEDSGKYTLEASNTYETKTLTNILHVEADPQIQFDTSKERILKGSKATFNCEVTGFPLPKVDWTFIDDQNNTETKYPGNSIAQSSYKKKSTLEMEVSTTGTLFCRATTQVSKINASKSLHVNEIAAGFGIDNGGQSMQWAPENLSVTLRCLASIYDFTAVNWLGPNNSDLPSNMAVENSNSSLSLIAILQIYQISLNQTGNYTCVGYQNGGYEKHETVLIRVAAASPPNIKVPELDTDTRVVYYNEKVSLVCIAEAVPSPEIIWFKNNKLVEKKEFYTYPINHTTVNSTYNFTKAEELTDEIVCFAKSRDLETSKTFIINLHSVPAKTPFKTAYLGIIGVIIFALIILVGYLTWKIKKEKQFRKELAAAGLLYFKEGATKSLNPDLGIDEQAELLPYDDKFEFPADKLKLGHQLGAGAFGVVYKAEARGIINAEDVTTVAVKMVKKTADNIYIKALASELKIMVHLGKHINIVNLLGACTKNVGKRELSVIVEFCKFGNIHNYLQRHREVFVDQFTDNKDKIQGNINRAFSCSSGNSGMNSDCFNSNQTQETDHTFLSTAPSIRSARTDKPKPPSEFEKVSETGYVQPEWRSNYESDYVFDGRKPRPLYSRDLLAWAFQIARGMEYLASRKILHGDLAARNILLAEDNVVKICDFGLARSIYKNDEYQKKENSPLPVKWLAVECMTDHIFSTQSDVWSFGIVLWELFSLAKTPYPEISPQNLLPRLLEGHRLDKPLYADDRLYSVMRSCWEQRPTKRPTFTELQKTLGSFLEDNVRNHYVELNEPCANTNADRTGEDYLVRVCAPDYNSQITPSPHHYANDANGFFFSINPAPTKIQLQHDDEGYLAMTPASDQNVFSPRLGPAFNFDARELNPRVSAASQGSELTPMLTLSHLSARSGSDSDHEGTASPYLNMYPRIEEETDEVFENETKQNNLKNSQNNAVTNPTYITFPSLEKKTPIIANNYINVTANGLVK